MWTMSDLLSSNFVNRSDDWAKKGRRLSGGGGGALAFMEQAKQRWRGGGATFSRRLSRHRALVDES